MSRYMVAPGKSVTTKTGTISEFRTITPRDVRSKAIFDAMIRCGTIHDKTVKPMTKVEGFNEPVQNSDKLQTPARVDVREITIISSRLDADRTTEDIERELSEVVDSAEKTEEQTEETTEDVEQVEEIEEPTEKVEE